jgi:hypothetical protein
VTRVDGGLARVDDFLTSVPDAAEPDAVRFAEVVALST